MKKLALILLVSCVPYQTQDGSWRMRFTIFGSGTNANISSLRSTPKKTLDKLVEDFKPVQKHVYMVNGAIKLISVVVAIAAGYVGELLTGQNSSGLALSSGVIALITGCQITLTPGEWDLSGVVNFSGSATATSLLALEVSTTSAGFGTGQYDGTDVRAVYSVNLSVSAHTVTTPSIIPVRVSANTTYYLNTQANFSGGTATAKGTIYARRRA
jgi:hypothetical protein